MSKTMKRGESNEKTSTGKMCSGRKRKKKFDGEKEKKDWGDETSKHIEEKKKNFTFNFQKWNPELFFFFDDVTIFSLER